MSPPDDPLEALLDTMFQAHPWHGVSPGDPHAAVQVYVEIVPTDVVKYELDKPSGHLRVDRPNRYSSLAPMPYGFVPRTFCGPRVGARFTERCGGAAVTGDGDPIDICVLTEKAFGSGNFLCLARPIGGLRMLDGDQADDKIVAVLQSDLAYGHVRELSEVPPAVVERLKHYFLTYKQLPQDAPRAVRIAEVYDRAEAAETLSRSLIDYREKFGAPEERVTLLRKLLGGAR